MGELKDQFGKSHKLEDYKGKVIFLNFLGNVVRTMPQRNAGNTETV